MQAFASIKGELPGNENLWRHSSSLPNCLHSKNSVKKGWKLTLFSIDMFSETLSCSSLFASTISSVFFRLHDRLETWSSRLQSTTAPEKSLALGASKLGGPFLFNILLSSNSVELDCFISELLIYINKLPIFFKD